MQEVALHNLDLSLVGKGKIFKPLHVPKMVQLCLKVDNQFWIDFQDQAGT